MANYTQFQTFSMAYSTSNYHNHHNQHHHRHHIDNNNNNNNNDDHHTHTQNWLTSVTTHLLPLVVTSAIFLVIGVVGNSTVCFVSIARMRRSVLNNFVLALALTELVGCMFTIPIEMTQLLNIYSFDYPGLCKFERYLRSFIVLFTSCLLIAIASERYQRIVKPHRKHVTTFQFRLTIVGSFVFSSVAAIPEAILAGTQVLLTDFGKGYKCSTYHSREYSDTVFPTLWACFVVVIYVISTTAIGSIYCVIAVMIWRRGKVMTDRRSRPNTPDLSLRRRVDHLRRTDFHHLPPKTEYCTSRSIVTTTAAAMAVVSDSHFSTLPSPLCPASSCPRPNGGQIPILRQQTTSSPCPAGIGIGSHSQGDDDRHDDPDEISPISAEDSTGPYTNNSSTNAYTNLTTSTTTTTNDTNTNTNTTTTTQRNHQPRRRSFKKWRRQSEETGGFLRSSRKYSAEDEDDDDDEEVEDEEREGDEVVVVRDRRRRGSGSKSKDEKRTSKERSSLVAEILFHFQSKSNTVPRCGYPSKSLLQEKEHEENGVVDTNERMAPETTKNTEKTDNHDDDKNKGDNDDLRDAPPSHSTTEVFHTMTSSPAHKTIPAIQIIACGEGECGEETECGGKCGEGGGRRGGQDMNEREKKKKIQFLKQQQQQLLLQPHPHHQEHHQQQQQQQQHRPTNEEPRRKITAVFLDELAMTVNRSRRRATFSAYGGHDSSCEDLLSPSSSSSYHLLRTTSPTSLSPVGSVRSRGGYSRKRTTFIMFVMTLTTLLSLLPHVIVILYSLPRPSVELRMSPDTSVLFRAAWNSFFISLASHPYVYGFWNSRFKKALWSLFNDVRKEGRRGINRIRKANSGIVQ